MNCVGERGVEQRETVGQRQVNSLEANSPKSERNSLKSETIGVLKLENQLAGVGRVTRDRRLRAVLQGEDLRAGADCEVHGHRTVGRLIRYFDERISALGERFGNTKPGSSWEHLAIKRDRHITPTQPSLDAECLRTVRWTCLYRHHIPRDQTLGR